MELACLDLEGVLIPEIWIAFAEKTGIEELKATTRDIPDYDVLMKQRLKLLDQHGYGLPQIQEVIGELDPLPGAREFLDWLRERDVKLAIITNKPSQFIEPLLEEKGLAGYFQWLIGGDTLPQQKPDPAALVWVMREAGVSADASLFVGDSRNDVRAAKAASVPCAALTYGYNHGEPIAHEQPALVLDDLRELVASVSGLR